MYDSYQSNFPQQEAYPVRSNHGMNRPVDYSVKPQMRPQQMPYNQPHQNEMGKSKVVNYMLSLSLKHAGYTFQSDYHRSNVPVMNPSSSTSSNSSKCLHNQKLYADLVTALF